MGALWPLQKAVMARLKADAGVTALVGTRIYDGTAPEGAPLPYLVIGDPTEEDARTLDTVGYRDTLTLDAWSAYQGRKEVLAILDAVGAALRTEIALDGHTAVRLRLDFSAVLVEDDNTRHGVARYRLLTFEAP